MRWPFVSRASFDALLSLHRTTCAAFAEERTRYDALVQRLADRALPLPGAKSAPEPPSLEQRTRTAARDEFVTNAAQEFAREHKLPAHEAEAVARRIRDEVGSFGVPAAQGGDP